MTQPKVLLIDFWVKRPKIDYMFNVLSRLNVDIYLLGPCESIQWLSEVIDDNKVCKTNLHDPVRALSDLSVFKTVSGVNFDAIITFEDQLTVLASILAQFNNCIYTPLSCQKMSSINKLLFRQRYNLFENPCFIKSDINLFPGQTLINNVPKVIKPIFGSDGQGVRKIEKNTDTETILSYLQRSCPNSMQEFKNFNNKFMLEDYVLGDVFSVDGIVQNGNIHFAGINQVGSCPEPYFTQISNTIPAQIDNKQKQFIYNNMADFIKFAEYDNMPFHAEIKYNNNKIYIIEIGCRAPGGQISKGYELAFGFNFIEQVFNLYLGRPVSFKRQYTKHIHQKGVYLWKNCVVDDIIVPKELPVTPDEFIIIAKPGDTNSYPKPAKPIYYYSVSADSTESVRAKANLLENSINIKTR